MGSGEEWANDGKGRSCFLTVAGLVSGGVVTLTGLAVLVADAVKLIG